MKALISSFNPFHSCCISYRNQSIDLLCKSNDWFLYEMQYWTDKRRPPHKTMTLYMDHSLWAYARCSEKLTFLTP